MMLELRKVKKIFGCIYELLFLVFGNILIKCPDCEKEFILKKNMVNEMETLDKSAIGILDYGYTITYIKSHCPKCSKEFLLDKDDVNLWGCRWYVAQFLQAYKNS